MHQRAFGLAGIAPDGWSLVNAVARAVGAADPQQLLRAALTAIATAARLDHVADADRAIVRQMAQSALAQQHVRVNSTPNPFLSPRCGMCCLLGLPTPQTS